MLLHGLARPFCWMLLLVLLPVAVRAQIQPPAPPEIAARAYVLIDLSAQQVLAAHQADQPLEPASLTKLMSAYLVFDALRAQQITLSQKLPISQRAGRMPGSRMFLQPEMRVAVDDLLKGMIVQSGNDATVALAEGVAGSVEQFVVRMNQQAQALAMSKTHFVNPEGLSAPGHVSTARDLATLAARLLSDFPMYTPLFAMERYHYPGTPAANASNRNVLLWRDPSVDGLKTGHTAAAGYNMVASAKRPFATFAIADEPAASQRRLISVVLGAGSEHARAVSSQRLLNWGFTEFEAVRLFAPGQTILEPTIWKGTSATVRLGRSEGVMLALPPHQTRGLRIEVLRSDPLIAPISKGQSAATLRISASGGQVLAELPLVALESVREAGWLGRWWGGLRLWLQ